jgi:hypothetical protein
MAASRFPLRDEQLHHPERNVYQPLPRDDRRAAGQQASFEHSNRSSDGMGQRRFFVPKSGLLLALCVRR